MTTVGKPMSTRTIRPSRASVSGGGVLRRSRSLRALLMPELCGNQWEKHKPQA